MQSDILVIPKAAESTAALVVSGTVTDDNGVPPASVFILLLSQEDYSLAASSATGQDGHYRLEARDTRKYLLFAIPFSGKVAEGYNLDWTGVRFTDDMKGNAAGDLFVSIDKGEAAFSDKASGTALWALENLERIRAEQDISRYRTGTIVLTLVDEAGNPVPGATVKYSQTTHDFLFGIFDTLGNAGVEGYELMRQAGINYFTNGFYWNETEPEQNRISWEYIDYQIGVMDLALMGFPIKAHGRGAALNFSREEITRLTGTGIRAIRENDPDARILINNAFDWWHRPWNELTQAEFVRDFYTIAFSKEYVEAITWWCINDNGSFVYTGGLLDGDNSPKSAYFALKDLIGSWTTAGEGKTNRAGQVTISGYGGEYELTVSYNEKTWNKTIHIREQRESGYIIWLPENQ